jgi:DnaD/phage-associated family protein
MAWIESHQGLRDNPKTRKLARLLDISVPAAIGHLQCLWWWAMDYAQDGELAKFDNEDIATAMMWGDEPETLVDALIDVRLIDKDETGLRIHDWFDYAGKLIERRANDRKRKQDVKEQKKKPVKAPRNSNGIPTEIRKKSERTRTVSVVTVPNPTVPYPTVPNQDVETEDVETEDVETKDENKNTTAAAGARAREEPELPSNDGADGQVVQSQPVSVRNAALGEVCDRYMQITGALLSPLVTSELEDFVREMEPGAIIHALDVALAENKRNWSYIKAILTRYRQEGLRTLAAVQAAEAERTQKRGGKSDGQSTKLWQK